MLGMKRTQEINQTCCQNSMWVQSVEHPSAVQVQARLFELKNHQFFVAVLRKVAWLTPVFGHDEECEIRWGDGARGCGDNARDLCSSQWQMWRGESLRGAGTVSAGT